MPVTSLQVRCNECRYNRPWEDMSIFTGICNQCFDTRYILCNDCGSLVSCPSDRANRPNPYNRHNLGAGLYTIDGIYCCYSCFHARRDSSRYWQPKPFDVSFATYQRIGSKRKYGVEIETHRCDRHEELHSQTNFGCKHDPTVCGAEFDSPILYGDEGLDYINKFLTFAEERDWSVNTGCGCHTHYDMRQESDERLYHIAYAYTLTYPMWKRCVSSGRASNSYCRRPRYTIRDIKSAYESRTFENFAEHRDRYDYVNLYAYLNHRTFEVRLLEGTLDSNEICNWITLHCRFIDCVKELPFNELRSRFRYEAHEQFHALTDLIDDATLTDWLAHRARHIGSQPLRGPRSVNLT